MLIHDQKERCGEWAKQHIPGITSWGVFEALGWEKDGELCVVVIYNLYSGADIAMHIAAIPGKKWLCRKFLKIAFEYPFVRLGVRRVSGYVPAKNLKALEFDLHLGFAREGYMRHALEDDDVVCLGMLKSECRWLK